MTDLETAYLAGLFDGEGNVGVHRCRATKNGRLYLRLVVKVTNTHRGCLDFARLAFGTGTIAEDKRPDMTNRRPCYRWVIVGKTAERFLRAVRPHLIIKADQVDQVLSRRHSGAV